MALSRHVALATAQVLLEVASSVNIDQPHTRAEWRELFIDRLREDGMPPLAAARRVADRLDEQAVQNLNAMARIGAAKVLVDAFYATIKHIT